MEFYIIQIVAEPFTLYTLPFSGFWELNALKDN
jgi:hypothetical protein